MNARVDHAVTSGTFSLDGQTFDVDNNVWVVGDDTECVVIDAPHDVGAILDVVGDRRLRAIIATHAHDDHVRVAPALSEATGAPVLLHPADLPVWRLTHPRIDPGGVLDDDQDIVVGGTTLRVLHTPGHSPGSCCLFAADLSAVFTGDTLFAMGCGRLFEGTPAMMWSSLSKLMKLPDATKIYCGHEYTLSNGKFALTMEPKNSDLQARMKDVEAARAKHAPTIPSTMGLEKKTNPFLRPDSKDIRATLGMESSDDVAVFAEIRKRKDSF